MRDGLRVGALCCGVWCTRDIEQLSPAETTQLSRRTDRIPNHRLEWDLPLYALKWTVWPNCGLVCMDNRIINTK